MRTLNLKPTFAMTLKRCPHCGLLGAHSGTCPVSTASGVNSGLFVPRYLIGLVLVFLGALDCLYFTIFYGWLTATPLTDSELQHAQFKCYLYVWLLVASVVLFVLLLVRLFVLARRADRHLTTAAA